MGARGRLVHRRPAGTNRPATFLREDAQAHRQEGQATLSLFGPGAPGPDVTGLGGPSQDTLSHADEWIRRPAKGSHVNIRIEALLREAGGILAEQFGKGVTPAEKDRFDPVTGAERQTVGMLIQDHQRTDPEP